MQKTLRSILVFVALIFPAFVNAQPSCDVIEMDASMLDSGAKSLGKVQAGAHSFTFTCTRPQVMEELREKACGLRANAIVITKEKTPGLWRSCFTITAQAYQISFNNKFTGVDVDDLLRLAGDGDIESQFVLGNRYLNGEGVEQNSVEAYAWFNLAASQNLVKAINARDDLERRLTWQQLAEAQERSVKVWESYYNLLEHRGVSQ